MFLPYILNLRRQPIFPSGLEPGDHGLIALGGRLTPEIIIEAYTRGIFPWTGEHPIPWFSPDPRLILRPEAIKVSRSLKQAIRRGHLEVRQDTCFRAMMRLCATIPRPGQEGTWITQNMVRTWARLHKLGFAHSIEVFEEGVLVGGLYGLAIGRAFFGESMCSMVPDASKIALVRLCEKLRELDFRFIDCQQETAHLGRMGAVALPRLDYLRVLEEAVWQPPGWSPPVPDEVPR